MVYIGRQLDRSEFNSEISLISLAKVQQTAFSNSLTFPMDSFTNQLGLWIKTG